MEILRVEQLSYHYQDGEVRRQIIKEVTQSFETGKFYAIMGESGTGKTTLLSLIAGLDEPASGVITYKEKDIKAIGYDEYRRNNVGVIFQSYNLVPYMSAVENVLVSMSITDNEMPADVKTVAYNLLDYLGITREKSNRPVTKLSGGEQQRVAIARALATNVDILLADEPTGNLNEEKEDEIVEIMQTLAREHGKCVILVTHSSSIAKRADIQFRFERGQLKQQTEENL